MSKSGNKTLSAVNQDETRVKGVKRLVILSQGSLPGSPVSERVEAFRAFYEQNGVSCAVVQMPQSFRGMPTLFRILAGEKTKSVLLTMPPFRWWLILLTLRYRVLLDIRDGWSIAMRTGYGMTVRPSMIKHRIARIIERAAFRRCALVITCTPGLMGYLAGLAGAEKIVLVPNGFRASEMTSARAVRPRSMTPGPVTFLCAGKFSEYGRDKVIRVLQKIERDFPGRSKTLSLVGCSYAENKWIADEWRGKGMSIEYVPRVDRRQLFDLIVSHDYAVAIIRDPEYDLGTKVFDYILCRARVYNYFEEVNGFVSYFKEYFERGTTMSDQELMRYSREWGLGESKGVLVASVR